MAESGEFWEQVAAVVSNLSRKTNHVIFAVALHKVFENKLGFVRKLRLLASTCFLVGVAFLFMGLFTQSPKLVNSAGLCFDIAGALILFLQDEWERLLEPYKNADEFPYGPPSHVTRDWFDFENPDVFPDPAGEDAEDLPLEMAKYYRWQRGIFLLASGFLLQLLAVWM